MADEKMINLGHAKTIMQEADERFIDQTELEERLEDVGSGVDGKPATLSTSWMEQADGTYAQTVTVAGVTADNQIIVDVDLSGADIDADIAVLEAWGMVNRAKQAANALTFYCYGDVPTVAIPLNVVVAG